MVLQEQDRLSLVIVATIDDEGKVAKQQREYRKRKLLGLLDFAISFLETAARVSPLSSPETSLEPSTRRPSFSSLVPPESSPGVVESAPLPSSSKLPPASTSTTPASFSSSLPLLDEVLLLLLLEFERTTAAISASSAELLLELPK